MEHKNKRKQTGTGAGEVAQYLGACGTPAEDPAPTWWVIAT